MKKPIIFIVGFAVIGAALILTSRAATPVNNVVEPETGNVTAGAINGQDVNASNGSYVSFQAPVTACPAGQTGTPPNCTPITANSVTGGTDTSCQFKTATQPVHVAFCEGFTKAYSNDPSVNRSGDLNDQLWGVSRNNTTWANGSQGQYNDYVSAHLTGCGATQVVFPTKDIQVCSDGFMHEALNDGAVITDFSSGDESDIPMLAIYPKQPFDIAGRTGTVSFDVSANSQGGHAAWPEIWFTDQPVPAPGGAVIDTVPTFRSHQSPWARNSYGFEISEDCERDDGFGTGDDNAPYVGIGTMTMTVNYKPIYIDFHQVSCVKKGSITSLNHFEMRINTTHVEIWGSDPGGANFREVAYADLPQPLGFTRGLLWMEDVHYNACKFDNQCDHDVAWDNFGFDGPATYRDLAFDVPDSNVKKAADIVELGYSLGKSPTFTIPGVFQLQTPTASEVTFDWYPHSSNTIPSISVNGNPYITTAWPFDLGDSYAWRTIAVQVPLSQVKMGTNTIQFKGDEDDPISNIDLILVAASPVPAALQ